MPELPEVETVRRRLAEVLTGRTVQGVSVLAARVAVGQAERLQLVVGRRIEEVKRRGKYLLLALDAGTLLVHLRMTGRLLLRSAGAPPTAHTRLVFLLDDGSALHFEDVRQFGQVLYVPEGEVFPAGLVSLGPEPLDHGLTAAHLGRLAKGRSLSLKAFLLDQRVVAGLGNIYADEALFEAGLHPARPVGALCPGEWRRLVRAIRQVLLAALAENGTTLRDYRDPDGQSGGFAVRLSVYGRQGEPCRRCGQPIVKIRIAGRGTHLCPSCQR